MVVKIKAGTLFLRTSSEGVSQQIIVNQTMQWSAAKMAVFGDWENVIFGLYGILCLNIVFV